MPKLADLLGHLLEGGVVIHEDDENTEGVIPYCFSGSIKLKETNSENTIMVKISGADAPEYKSYYTPEQEEIRRLKQQLEASQEEISRLVLKEKDKKVPRVQMDLELYIELREQLDLHPNRSTANLARDLNRSYGLVARIKAGHYAELEVQYLEYRAKKLEVKA